MNKILILKIDNEDENLRKTEYCDIEKYYNCKVNNIVFRVFKKLDLKISNIFIGKWKKDILKYQTVILFDNGYSKIITRYIKEKNPKCRIILWFWNPIIEYSESYLKDKNIDEIWSYDRNDCKKYNLKFNTQFYNNKLKCPNLKKVQDVIFLGKDKGRRKIIENLNESLAKNKVTSKLMIVESEKQYISYSKYLEYIGESKAILDIVMDNVMGLTLRCMESLFLNKKLITNNTDIQNYDFYNPKNIFILGKDDVNDIKNFIDSEYEPVKEEIVDYYDYESWIKRFGV